jgi:hypothetical protein
MNAAIPNNTSVPAVPGKRGNRTSEVLLHISGKATNQALERHLAHGTRSV